MRILALDTATEACSVALLDGTRLVTRYEEPGRGHAERILPMVDAVLTEGRVKLAELDGIAVGRGPGAFTGVRIAISIAQGLAFGAGKLVAPISDLAALAQRALDAHRATRVLACIDARMEEIYWGWFGRDANGLAVAASEERVSAAADVQFPVGTDWHGIGSGWRVPALCERARAAELPPTHLYPALFPRAEEIARLGLAVFQAGDGLAAEQALPVYLRDRVATPMSQKSRT
jgi:tRNA threonylcarbamoyladenosine biosynthesis protein TsaB